MSDQRKTAVIIGASSGIGLELAKTYQKNGFRVALLARRLERLEALAAELNGKISGSAIAIAADVTKRSDLDAAAERIRREFGEVDTVIANSGFGVSGLVENLTTADYRRQFDTNVFGVLDCFYAFREDLEKARGHFAVIGSVNSYIALPSTSAYCMSKFSVRAFAEALHWEWKPKGVAVTLVCPGFVHSEIRRVNNQGKLSEKAQDPIPNWIIMDTDVAARKIFLAVERGKREYILTGHGKVLVWLERHCRWLFAPMLAKLGRERKSRTRAIEGQ